MEEQASPWADSLFNAETTVAEGVLDLVEIVSPSLQTPLQQHIGSNLEHQQTQRRLQEEKHQHIQVPWRIEDHLVQMLSPEEYATGLAFCQKLSIPGRTLSNLTPLLALSPQRLRIVVEHLRSSRSWTAETTKAKLAPLISLATRMHLDPHIVETIRVIVAEKHRRSPAWLPQDLDPIVNADPPVIRFAFLTGQRVSDCLRIRAEQIFQITTPTWQTLAVMITAGKVVQKTGPWCLHLLPNGQAHQILRNSWDGNSAYVFFASPPLSVQEETAMIVKLEMQLKHLFPNDLRNPRRLGLSTGALNGMSNCQLQTLSQHPDARTLRIYLASGMLDKATGEVHHQFQRFTEAALTTSIGDRGWSVTPFMDMA